MSDAADKDLLTAVKGRNLADFRKALDNGARPDAADADTGRTALYYVASLDMSNIYRTEMLKALLARNADVNKGDKLGVTPLHEAVRRAEWTVMEALVGQGADLNARSNNGSTPLHVATGVALGTGKMETLRRLLDAGANSLVKNAKGQTPLDLARSRDGFANFYATVISFLDEWEKNKTDARRHSDIAEANKEKLQDAAATTIKRMRSDAKRFRLKP